MATLTITDGRDKAAIIRAALERAELPLAPIATDPASASLATSQRFLIGAAGDSFVFLANGEFHLVCGGSSIAATTSSPGPFPAGVYRLVLPDGCTHVAMIRGAAGAASGCAYPG